MENSLDTQTHSIPFRFHGSAGEYFRIWIVNVVLSILTLGIYTAWAKVRNKRYFYSNTELDGSSFEYLADPMSILKGRLIAFGVFAIYSVTVTFLPMTEPVFIVAFVACLPWLVVRALTFNARNSAFRNIRFDFRSNYREAAKVYIGIPLLIVLTLGLAYPWFAYKHRDFIVNNSGFGTADFDFDARARQFYAIYIKAFGGLLLTGLVLVVMMSVLTPEVQAADPVPAEQPAEVPPELLFAAMLPLLVMFPVYLLAGIYIQTATANMVFNHAFSAGQRFNSTLRTGRMFWIYITNLVMIVVSLGLLIPWAKIRTTRYRLDHLAVESQGSLDSFIAGEQERVRATGEEFAEVFDIDLGL